jgi:CheY-like chemotaxis protein/anti-sigma regulatory factor (Ser/Thr protein kinase)
VAKRIERSVRSADRLDALIESLLDVSRIATGKLVLAPAAIDLAQLVPQIVDRARSMAAKAGCALSLSMSGPVRGCWDCTRLQQVLMNLLANALKYGAGGPVSVTVTTDGADAVIEVADNGPGITPEVLPRIFESFYTTKPRGMGTGLGLPISLGIVRALGGEITVDTHPGEGAIFRVRLPAGELSAPGPVTPVPDDARPRSFARRRILAVDDEALLLKAYRRMLADTHELVTALGGHEALRTLERDAAFDVVLCDLQMPEMSGMELHAAVRARHPALADKFLFVTGGAFSSDARRFLEDSVAAIIHKPFRIEDLLSLVDKIASGVPVRRKGSPSSPTPSS